MGLLTQLAGEVGVNERTLRRAVYSGLIQARRQSARRIVLSDAELTWVRLHWSLISQLRAAVRTEPNLELMVLFGSAARGDEVAGISDVDLLVDLRHPYPGAMEQLRSRLSDRLSYEVQLVSLERARRNPRLMAEILRDGRPVVDRGQVWPRLQADGERTLGRADRSGMQLRAEAQTAVGYFRRLAAARARAPLSLET